MFKKVLSLFSLVTITLLALAPKGGAAEPVSTREVTICLEPGEGTILLLGNEDSFKALQDDLQNPKAVADRTGVLKRMPFGVYISSPQRYAPTLKERGIEDAFQWYKNLLTLLKNSGVNTVYLQGGASISPQEGRPLKELAALFEENDIQFIIQPDDVYFGGGTYANWKRRRLASKGENADVSYQAFFDDYIKRVVTQYLPRFAEDRGIFAWSPVEELPPQHEAVFAQYKALIRELLPNSIIYQLDSPQSTKEKLQSKTGIIPDILAFDRYCWWHQEAGETDGFVNYRIWTPHFAARWLNSVLGRYARDAYELYKRPMIAVVHGGAGYEFFGEERARRYGWKRDESYVYPLSPDVRYYPKHDLWGLPNQYFPPKHAMKLSSWIAICAGYKGVMLYGSLGDHSDYLATFLQRNDLKHGSYLRYGSIRYDLSVTPQWEEFATAAKNIQRYAPIVLDWEPATEPHGKTSQPNVFSNSFTDSKGRKYLVVVNGLIGSWDGGKSPDWIRYPESRFSVGEDGQLIGYEPLEGTREIRVQLPAQADAYDLRTLFPANQVSTTSLSR